MKVDFIKKQGRLHLVLFFVSGAWETNKNPFFFGLIYLYILSLNLNYYFPRHVSRWLSLQIFYRMLAKQEKQFSRKLSLSVFGGDRRSRG